MSHFEYITVAVSIILALSVARLLDGIGPALHGDGRYWVVVGWIAQKFLNIVLWWWSLWLIQGTQWNLGAFLYEMIGPIVLYLQAKALVTPSGASPDSWKVRFEEIRVWFFIGNIVLALSSLLSSQIVALVGFQIPYAALGFLILLAIIGIAFRQPRVQAVVVILALASQIVGLGGAVFELGR